MSNIALSIGLRNPVLVRLYYDLVFLSNGNKIWSKSAYFLWNNEQMILVSPSYWRAEWSASFHTIDGWCYLFYCKIKHNYMWHWNTMSGMKLDDEDFERLYRLISVYSVCWWWEVTEVIRKHYRVCPQVDKTKFKESLSTILVYTMWYIKKMISQWNRLMIYRKLINYLDNRVKKSQTSWFQVLNCLDFLIYFVSCDSKVNILDYLSDKTSNSPWVLGNCNAHLWLFLDILKPKDQSVNQDNWQVNRLWKSPSF